jgi:hypothetical protein
LTLRRRVVRRRADLGLAPVRAGASFVDVVNVRVKLAVAAGGPAESDRSYRYHLCLCIANPDVTEIAKELADFRVLADEIETRYGAVAKALQSI